jgi:hypothetical protein
MTETIARKIAIEQQKKSRPTIDGQEEGDAMKSAKTKYPDFEETCGYGSVTGIGGA